MIIIEDNVLTSAECDALISQAAHNLEAAATVGNKLDTSRKAKSTWLTNATDVAEKIKHIAAYYSSRPIICQEHIHIVKYEIGDEYRAHYDFFDPTVVTHAEELARGGQRTHSCLFYLNEDYRGGHTQFPRRNLIITPKQGRMLMWTNVLGNQALDYDSFHAGLPVTDGEKWICIVWIRERSFNPHASIIS